MEVKDFSEVELKILSIIHVGIPWKFLPKYLEPFLREGMGIEIGIGAEELDGVLRKDFILMGEVLRDKGVRYSIHGPFWDLCPGSVDPLIRNATFVRFHQLMDICEIMHPCQIVFHTGFDPRHHREHTSEFIDRSIALWESLVKRAEHIGSPIVIENVWEEGPDIHRRILDRINSPFFGFCLDVGHRNTFARTSLEEWLEVLMPYLKEIHIHDNDGSCDAHFPPGTGTVNFKRLFGKLMEHDSDPILTIEPHREEHFYDSVRNLSEIMPSDLIKRRCKRLAK